MLKTLRWACRRCGRGREFLEREEAPEAFEGEWFWRCALCGTPADTFDPLGVTFTVISAEGRCPN